MGFLGLLIVVEHEIDARHHRRGRCRSRCRRDCSSSRLSPSCSSARSTSIVWLSRPALGAGAAERRVEVHEGVGLDVGDDAIVPGAAVDAEAQHRCAWAAGTSWPTRTTGRSPASIRRARVAPPWSRPVKCSATGGARLSSSWARRSRRCGPRRRRCRSSSRTSTRPASSGKAGMTSPSHWQAVPAIVQPGRPVIGRQRIGRAVLAPAGHGGAVEADVVQAHAGRRAEPVLHRGVVAQRQADVAAREGQRDVARPQQVQVGEGHAVGRRVGGPDLDVRLGEVDLDVVERVRAPSSRAGCLQSNDGTNATSAGSR